MKKFILPIFTGILVLIAVPITVYLVKQNQDIRNRASSPTGNVTVKLSPATKSDMHVGDTLPVDIKVTPPSNQSIAYTVIQMLLTYQYTGSTPEISIVDSNGNAASSIQTGNVGGLTFSNNKVTVDDANKTVYIELMASGSPGYIPTGEFTFGSFILKANAPTNGVTILFNSSLSKLYQADSTDVLLTPDNSTSGNYAVLADSGTTQHYRCSGSTCVADATGSHTTSNCDNACVATTQHYRCSGSSCVPDASGPYTTSNCNNACTVATTTHYHLTCQSNACVQVACSPATTACADDSDCTGKEEDDSCGVITAVTRYQHLICQNNACKKVDCVPDTVYCDNDRECSVENASCTPGSSSQTATATHKTCVNNTCVLVTGSGVDTCTTDASCETATGGIGGSNFTTTTTTTTTTSPTETQAATTPVLPETGATENTLLIVLGGLLLMGIGLLSIL